MLGHAPPCCTHEPGSPPQEASAHVHSPSKHYPTRSSRRRAGSPDEETWPGVSGLPEWHSSLPRFPRRRPSSAALRIDALEADLLDVSIGLQASGAQRGAMAALASAIMRPPRSALGLHAPPSSQRLLALHPESRLTAGEALAHPLFDELFPSPQSHRLAHDVVAAAAPVTDPMTRAHAAAHAPAASKTGTGDVVQPVAAASSERLGANSVRGSGAALDSSLVARALDFAAAPEASEACSASIHGAPAAPPAHDAGPSERGGSGRPRRKRGRAQGERGSMK